MRPHAEDTELMTTDRIRESEVRHERVTEILDAGWRHRVFDPRENPERAADLVALRESWRQEDWPTTTVFTVGVYDMLHADHKGYLVNTKLSAAPTHFERHYADAFGISWDELQEADREAWAYEFLVGGELRQIIGIDGNTRVAKRKGFDPQKGGSPRPVFDWETRALSAADITVKRADGVHIPLADAITIHDPDELPGSPHHFHLDLAAELQPDVWSIYYESEDLVRDIPADPRLDDVEVALITPGHYYYDKNIDIFSTTNIVKRIKGERS